MSRSWNILRLFYISKKSQIFYIFFQFGVDKYGVLIYNDYQITIIYQFK